MFARKVLILFLPLLLVIAINASPIIDGDQKTSDDTGANNTPKPESQVAEPEKDDEKNKPTTSNDEKKSDEKNGTQVNFIYASPAENPKKQKHDKNHPSTVDIVVKVPPEADSATVRPTLFINPTLKTTTIAPKNDTTPEKTTAAPETAVTCAPSIGTYYDRPNELRGYECPTRNGFFRYRKTCDVYIKCEDYIPRTYICDEGLQFNPDAKNKTEVCYDASVVKCEAGAAKPSTPKTDLDELRCPTKFGYYKTDECDEYVECKAYKPYRYKCLDGLGFNPRAVWPHYPCAPLSILECGSASSDII